MIFFLLSVGLYLAGGLAVLAVRHSGKALMIGAVSAVAGSVLGLLAVIPVLFNGLALHLEWPWSMPLGALTLDIDRLSAFFLLPILVLAACCAVYGKAYLACEREGTRAARAVFLFNLLTVTMMLVCAAKNMLLFLLAWEGMALFSFFLVAFDAHKTQVRRAAWLYFVAMHAGAIFVILLFVNIAGETGSFDFRSTGTGLNGGTALLCFLLGLIGFGTKAGIFPFHIWLPEAHPAAPSHVSALMSGVMIKTGIYGLCRLLTFFPNPPLLFGGILIVLGLLSALFGVLFATAQSDLKRTLAYSSVENIGLILLGLGLGLSGQASGKPAIAFIGFSAALLHVVNHAFFKGLLFLSAGSVLHGTGSTQMDRLGGLLRTMPKTAFAFFFGAAALVGLPPLNGFMGEFLLFLASFKQVAGQAGPVGVRFGALLSVGLLAMVAALSCVAFTRAFSITFLGAPREVLEPVPHEADKSMIRAMVALMIFSLLSAVTAPWFLSFLPVPMADDLNEVSIYADEPSRLLLNINVAALVLLFLIGLLVLWRNKLLSGRKVAEAVTWDCGYTYPSSRMQYTASSFSEPITRLFAFILRTRHERTGGEGFFPQAGRLSTHTPDLGHEGFYRPVLKWAETRLYRFRRFQEGRIQLYVLYMIITLIVLLVWGLRDS